MKIRSVLMSLAICLPCAATSGQPCEGVWSDAFVWGGIEGIHDKVQAMIVFDDSSGPALFVATDYLASFGGSVGGVAARFDGHTWEAADEGLANTTMLAFEVFDDGSGPALFATTSDDDLRRWNGQSWDLIAAPSQVYAGRGLEVFDDGTGPALYAGAGKWDGTTWTKFETRLIDIIAAVDNGVAKDLYASDDDELLRLENGTYKEVRPRYEIRGQIHTMTAHDDGSGMMLYVGGRFDHGKLPNANNIAKFDGNEWIEVGLGLPDDVYAFAHSPIDGSLIALGGNNTGYVAKWDGTSWEMIEEHLQDGGAFAAAVGDIGHGDQLYFGGEFQNDIYSGPPLSYLAAWDGYNILHIGNGLEGYGYYARYWPALAFESYDDGSDESLYVGGSMRWAGQTLVNGIARWDGQAWSAVGERLDNTTFIHALEVFTDSTGQSLLLAAAAIYPPGSPARCAIMRWDGSEWSELAEADGIITALTFVPDGPFAGLYAGGDFTQIDGVLANRLARLDTKTGIWQKLGTGIDGRVTRIEFLDNATETSLFVCGRFSQVGSNLASGFARWSGSQWQAIEISGATTVKDLGVYDIGSGPQLFIAGPVSGVWNGSDVTSLPDKGYFYKPVSFEAVAGFDDGAGPAAYFARGGEMLRWDGASAMRLPMAPDGGVSQGFVNMSRVDLKGESSLFFGGPSTVARSSHLLYSRKSISSGYIAQYLGCGGSCYADCDKATGVGTLDVYDFLCFQEAFVTSSNYACECDLSTGPRTCDVFDFLCFQNAFVTGCQ